MHNDIINWNDLKILLTIYRSGSLSKAAIVLGVNQSTMSRRLSLLEKQLGVLLFYRSKTAMRATEHGRAMITKAEAMESELENALEQVGRTRSEPMGLIRFVTMPWICNHIITPNLPPFSARFPRIQIEAVAAVRERFMDKGEVELALRFEMRPRGPIKNIPVAHVPYAVYAPQGADPDRLPWLGFRADQGAYAPQNWLVKYGSDTRVLFWANDSGILYEGVRNGLGKALLPMVLGENNSKLSRLSGDEPEIERMLHVQVLPDIQRLKRVELFLEWLAEMLPDAFANGL